MEYPLATLGTGAAILVAVAVERVGSAWIRRRTASRDQCIWFKSNLRFSLTLACGVVIAVLWFRLSQNKGTLFGILGAGLAIALREPLLSLAGRLSIWAGNMYRVGDRIEFQNMAGDVVRIGIFYTRMLEIGNWVHADQATGRFVQFPNSLVYQTSIFNYTQNFRFIWDEIALPVTYGSDVAAARQIMEAAAREVTEAMVRQAQTDIASTDESSLLPDLRVEPAVFTEVTSNYVSLTLRYVVDPRQRRQVRSDLYGRIFGLVRENENVTIGSDTMDLTVHPPEEKRLAG
jgi:small-conductance mechanosensitive channel